MDFQTWAHERVPVLKNGSADFHHCWFVDSI